MSEFGRGAVSPFQDVSSKLAVPFQLFELEDGRQAIDFLGHTGPFSDPASSPRPDLLLLDLKMPGTDGFEVLEWLRENPQHSPLQVVVLSGSEMEKDIQRAKDLGASAYLAKPPKAEHLVPLLARNTDLAA